MEWVRPFTETTRGDARNGTCEHLFAAGTGTIPFHVDLAGQTVNTDVKLHARLSSEGPGSDSGEQGSRVHLRINNINVGSQMVVPDDSIGHDYVWSFPSKMLNPRQNLIEFRVEPGEAGNGLCIYGKSLVSGRNHAFIRLTSNT